MSDCLFCRIGRGEIPATVVYETDDVMAFRDVAPVAPSHVLVIPKAHFANLGELTASDADLTQRVLVGVGEAAAAAGVQQGYRVVFNTGSEAGQTVDHVHAHVIGGRTMMWPPG